MRIIAAPTNNMVQTAAAMDGWRRNERAILFPARSPARSRDDPVTAIVPVLILLFGAAHMDGNGEQFEACHLLHEKTVKDFTPAPVLVYYLSSKLVYLDELLNLGNRVRLLVRGLVKFQCAVA